MTKIFTIGSGRNGTKSMAVILGATFNKSFHEYQQLVKERRRTYIHMGYAGPQLKAKIRKYQKMGEFHDSDNCNTVFMHHLCKAFPDAKILLPIGSVRSFVRAHRAWGIMGPKDKNVNTRMFPTDNCWANWPIVAKLAWLWGKRNIEAIKRSDRKRLMVFRTKDISKKLEEIFRFVGKPINNRAVKLAKARHNKLTWDTEVVRAVEREIDQNMEYIERAVIPFKRAIERFYPHVFK